MISRNFFKKCCFLFVAAGSGSLAYNVCASERQDFSDESPNLRTAYLVKEINLSSVTLMAKASEGAGSLLAEDTICGTYQKVGVVFNSVPYCTTKKGLAYGKAEDWFDEPCYKNAEPGASFTVRNPAADTEILIQHPQFIFSILSEIAVKSTDSSQKEQLTSLLHDSLDHIYLKTPDLVINLLQGRSGDLFYYASSTETLDSIQSSYRVNPARANFDLAPKCLLTNASNKFLDCARVLIRNEEISYTELEYIIVAEAFKKIENIEQTGFF